MLRRLISTVLAVGVLAFAVGCPPDDDPTSIPRDASPEDRGGEKSVDRRDLPDGQSDPFTADPEPELFAVPPEQMIETERWGRVPPHVIDVVLHPDRAEADADAVAAALGGRVVGRLRSRRLYQIETSAATEAELAATLDAARAHEAVLRAFPLQEIEEYRCHRILDDPVYVGIRAKPYEIIHLEDAWEMLSGAAALGIVPQDVTIGVVDSPVNTHAAADELKAIRLVIPSSSDRMEHPWTDTAGQLRDGGFRHGTQVSHVLAADAENGGVAGVAGLLKKKLTLIHKSHVNASGTEDLDKALYSLEQIISRGGRIINMSWGRAKPHPDRLAEYRDFMSDYPHVLFVAAAGNDNLLLDGDNLLPGGTPLPNLVTVGSIDNDRVWDSKSNRPGPGGDVMIVAPGASVPRIVAPDGIVLADKGGTSMAAPQVTAAAAMMLALDPSLSAADLKKLLIDSAEPAFTLDGLREMFKADAQPLSDDDLRAALDQMPQRVLRVDRCVLAVVNRLRGKAGQPPVTGQELMSYCGMEVAAAGNHPSFDVRVTLSKVGPGGTEVELELAGEGAIDAPAQRFERDGQSRTAKATLGAETGVVIARRRDTGGRQSVELRRAATRLFVEMPGTPGVLIHKKGPFGGFAYAWPGDRQPFEGYKQPVWERPYLIVVRAGNETQYVYPRNVQGLENAVVNLGTDRFHFDNFDEIEWPDHLTLTAVMPDGKVISERIDIVFRPGPDRPGPPVRPGGLPSYPAELDKARENYRNALNSPKTGVAKVDEVVAAAGMLLPILRDTNEAAQVAGEARRQIEALAGMAGTGGVNPAVIAQRRPGWELRVDSGQLASFYVARDVPGFMRWLDELEKVGRARTDYYLWGALLAVRFANDTDDAQHLWNQARALRKAPPPRTVPFDAIVGLPRTPFGLPSSLPSRGFLPADVDKPLALPPQPIPAP
ncbi:MAG: S8/S53 family peptidase [Planctomycetales bacterium]